MDNRGIRHTWVARESGIGKALFGHYVNRRRPVPAERARRIAAVLGVPLFLLFESLTNDTSSPASDDQAA